MFDKENGGLTVTDVICLTDRWKIVNQRDYKPNYTKRDQFVHFYVD